MKKSLEVFSGLAYDYEPIFSPSALAEISEIVVTATIERVQEGRLEIVPANDSIPGVSTIVLVLSDAEAVEGNLAEDSDGFVYVELPNPGQRDPDAYARGLCAGSQVVAYLVTASDGAPQEGIDRAVADPLAGRPDGQALYIPSSPQGLIQRYRDEAVVWPLQGETRDGEIEDTLPTGTLIVP